MKATVALKEGWPIGGEKNSRRNLTSKMLLEGLDDGRGALPAFPYDQDPHVIDPEAGSVDARTKCRVVGSQLPQDRGLLDPASHDRHGAAVDLEEEELAILGRGELRVRDSEDAVRLEVKRAP